jgi:hypothetical protein
VLDRARSTPRKPHDLHRGRAEGGLHDAHVRHQGSPSARISAQIPAAQTEKQQVNPPQQPRNPNREPSQVKQDLRDQLRAAGLLDKIGEDHIFMTLPTAVEAYRNRRTT